MSTMLWKIMGRNRHSFKGFHHGINPQKATPSSHWVQGWFSNRTCPHIGLCPFKELNPDSSVVQLFPQSFLHFSFHRVSLRFNALWLTPHVFSELFSPTFFLVLSMFLFTQCSLTLTAYNLTHFIKPSPLPGHRWRFKMWIGFVISRWQIGATTCCMGGFVKIWNVWQQEKPILITVCQEAIPHELVWYWNRAVVTKSRHKISVSYGTTKYSLILWLIHSPQSFLQQVHSLINSEFPAECDLMLPVSNFSIISLA